MTHTPGPWTAKGGNGARFDLMGADGFPLLRINGGMTPVPADARLIAAAPDLLAALEEITAHTLTRGETLRIASAALARAKGES